MASASATSAPEEHPAKRVVCVRCGHNVRTHANCAMIPMPPVENETAVFMRCFFFVSDMIVLESAKLSKKGRVLFICEVVVVDVQFNVLRCSRRESFDLGRNQL